MRWLFLTVAAVLVTVQLFGQQFDDFSFRFTFEDKWEEPDEEPGRWTAARRSLVEKRFREFLSLGGFPEAQELERSLRVQRDWLRP